jgi:hypothetical protein
VLAFDEPGKPALSVDDLMGSDAKKLRLGIQPYITLLHLHWPLDDFTIALKQNALRGQASNAVDSPSQAASKRQIPPPAKYEIFVAMHRLDNELYYKRLDRNAFVLLQHLQNGKTLAGAVAATIRDGADASDWTS